MKCKELENLSNKLRVDALDIIMSGKGGHIGGDMSVMDILTELYFDQMNIYPENSDDPDRDYFILSKGHSMEAYYAVLCEKGFLDLKDVIEKFSKFGSAYIGHPNNILPGIEMNSGSLGHGLPVAVGIALGNKKKNRNNRTYVILGDGELAEGSVWEGFMSASMYKLNNLCAVIDRNGLQISGKTEDIMSQEPLDKRIESFGWNVISVDGNDFSQLKNAFELSKNTSDRPSCIIAKTIKGYGSSVMEGKASWHHHVPSEEEYTKIRSDLTKKGTTHEQDS